MQVFKINPEAYNALVKKRFRVIIPILACLVLLVVGINFYSVGGGSGIYLITFIVMIALFSFSSYRGIRRQKDLVLSYSITINESEITREQQNTPTLTINFMEVKEIIKTKRGGFMIKGRTSTDVIQIPHLIENGDELERQLGKFGPITVWTKDPWFFKYRGLLFYFLGLAAMITINTTNNMIVAVIAGLLVIGLLIWRFVTIRRSKNATDMAKRRSWTYVAFAVLIAFLLYIRYAAAPFGH